MADTCCQAVAAPLGHLPQCLCTAHPSVQNTSIGLSHSLSFSINVISSDGHLPLVYTKQPIPILITSHVWGEVVSKQPMEQGMAVGEYLSTSLLVSCMDPFLSHASVKSAGWWDFWSVIVNLWELMPVGTWSSLLIPYHVRWLTSFMAPTKHCQVVYLIEHLFYVSL